MLKKMKEKSDRERVIERVGCRQGEKYSYRERERERERERVKERQTHI